MKITLFFPPVLLYICVSAVSAIAQTVKLLWQPSQLFTETW